MPDFSQMDEAELKAFRLTKNGELSVLRDEIRAAGRALEALRAAQDKARLDAMISEHGAEAVAAASNIITAPPAQASSKAPQIGAN